MARFGLRASVVQSGLRPGAHWKSRGVRARAAGAPTREARTAFENGDDTRGEIIVRSGCDGVVDSVHIVLGIAP